MKTSEYEYIGVFREDKRHGMGSCFFSDGSFYSGPWRNDRMDTNVRSDQSKLGFVGRAMVAREGVWISADAAERYIGDWYHDRYQGQGILYREIHEPEFVI